MSKACTPTADPSRGVADVSRPSRGVAAIPCHDLAFKLPPILRLGALSLPAAPPSEVSHFAVR